MWKLFLILFVHVLHVNGKKYLGCFREISIETRLLPGANVERKGTLTNDLCVDYCKKRNFRYAGTQYKYECFCSTSRPSFKKMTLEEECDASCDGNSTDICGGNWKLSVYDTTDAPDEYIPLNSIGCFSDSKENRLLRGPYVQGSYITPQYCIGLCYGQGFRTAGVQNGDECYCGATVDQSRKVDEPECETPCSGDSTLTCGGGWRISVFSTGLPDIKGSKYLGCYRDPMSQTRLLSGVKMEFKKTLTNERCISFCKDNNFKYAGTEWEIECFCSNDRPSYKVLANEELCKAECSGDRTQVCGGGLVISVYDVTGKGGDPISKQYEGCYPSDKGLVEIFKKKPNKLNPERCVGHCFRNGFRYAGLKAGNECVCGEELNGVMASDARVSCSSKCSGDPLLTCGGPTFTSVYKTGVPGVEVEEKNYLGCFRDENQDARVLSGIQLTLKETNTPKRCINICLASGNYKYSGTQYGIECFCGNKRPGQDLEVGEDECKTKCSGNRNLDCGGNSRLLVYSTEGTTPEKPPPDTGVRPPTNCNKLSLTTVNGKAVCQGQTILSEKFDAKAINTDVWSYDIFMSDYPEYYFTLYDNDPKNSFIQSGKFVIKPTLLPDELVRFGKKTLVGCTMDQFSEECTKEAKTFSIIPPVQSARINTKNSFAFKYGKIVIRAKLPLGDWILPELNLKPAKPSYGPDFNSGEIRIGMARGNQKLTHGDLDISNNHLEAGVLLGVGENVKTLSIVRDAAENWHSQFHNYTLRWTPDNLYFSVDNGLEDELIVKKGDKLVDTTSFSESEKIVWKKGSLLAPFDKEFYISLGISVGGGKEFPDCSVSNGQSVDKYVKPWTNNNVKAMSNFWRAKPSWIPTWNDKKAVLVVDSITVTAL